MSGISFPEKITHFLRKKMETIAAEQGVESQAFKALYVQYVQDEREDSEGEESNLKHYEAGFSVFEGDSIPGIERFYRRSMVVEPTMVCVAHCRYCLRANYDKHTLSEKQLIEVAQLCGNEHNRKYLKEILVTGGDPMIIPKRLLLLVEAMEEYAPNVKIMRFATRIPTQDPERIDEDAVRLFKPRPNLRLELATQINHPVELEFSETREAFSKILAQGARVYSQNVLLKGVNDDPMILVDLYDAIRENNIEAHYLFHPIPLAGTHHLRMSVDRGLKIARKLTSCGFISGRAKPMFSLMTDIGKVTLYHGSVVEKKGKHLLIDSGYKVEDRLVWNPSWQMPNSAVIGPEGQLMVWYLDGDED